MLQADIQTAHDLVLNIAQMLFERGEFDEALRFAERAASQRPLPRTTLSSISHLRGQI